MKKVISIIMAASIFALSFTSCEKDENKIKPANELEGIISTTQELDADYVLAKTYVNEGRESEVLGQSNLTDKKFSIKLQTPTKLNKIWDDIPNSVTISNSEVKGVVLSMQTLKGDEPVDAIICGKSSVKMGKDWDMNGEVNMIMFTYVDSDIQITGEHLETIKLSDEELQPIHKVVENKTIYNLEIKKGWNLINFKTTINSDNSEKISAIIEMTAISEIPSDYKWYLESEAEQLLMMF